MAGTPTIIPMVTGKSWISGLHTIVLHQGDPFAEGFTVGDIWA
ncbi:MAG: proline racemase family protein [Alphaproteobacteria bacterium]|nr:proline racemase family protein [Alphaproteobacteria bacterium]